MSTRIAPALGWRIRKAGQGTVIAGSPLSRARSSFSVSKRPPGRSIIVRAQVTCPATIGSTVTVAPWRAARERLMQRFGLHVDLHRAVTLPGVWAAYRLAPHG